MSKFKTSIKNNYSTAVSVGHDKEFVSSYSAKTKSTVKIYNNSKTVKRISSRLMVK